MHGIRSDALLGVNCKPVQDEMDGANGRKSLSVGEEVPLA